MYETNYINTNTTQQLRQELSTSSLNIEDSKSFQKYKNPLVFPLPIMLYIFSFLGPTDLNKVALVCYDWYESLIEKCTH